MSHQEKFPPGCGDCNGSPLESAQGCSGCSEWYAAEGESEMTREEAEDLWRYMMWRAGEFSVRVSAPCCEAGGER